MDAIPTTVRGRIGQMDDLAETRTGRKLLKFRVAENSSYLDKKSGEWMNRETVWTQCEAWGEFAERLATHLPAGTPVLLVGEPRARTYETEEGEKRTRKWLAVFAGGEDYSQSRKSEKTADEAPAAAESKPAAEQPKPAGEAGSDDPYDE